MENDSIAATLMDSGYAHYLEAEYALAADKFEATVALVPDYYDGHRWLGYAYWKLEMWSVAKDSFARAMMIDPGKFAAYWALSETYGYLDDKTSQRKTLQDAVLAVEDIPGRRLMLGLLAYFDENFQAAAELLSVSRLDYPDELKLSQILGYALNKIGDYQTAIEVSSHRLSLPEPTVYDRYAYGYALYRSGNFVAAVDALQAVLKQNPNHLSSLKVMGSIAWKRRDFRTMWHWVVRSVNAQIEEEDRKKSAGAPSNQPVSKPNLV